MKLSLTLHDKTYSVESNEQFDGSNVNELAEQFKGLLVSAGFHPSNVDQIFNIEYQWFTDEERADLLQGHYNSHESEKMERLARDRKIQQFQDNMYKGEDIFK
jgi:Tat protein secretion system quality control protein TatD with DNase activity